MTIDNKKIVIFDLGNVLIDINVNGDEFLSKIALYRKDKSEKISADMFKNLNIEFNRGVLSREEFFYKMIEILDIEITIEKFYDFWTGIFTENKILLPFARFLKQKYPNTMIIIASNTDEAHYPFIKKVFNIDFVDFEFLSYCEKLVKPDSAFFERLITKYNLDNYVLNGKVIFIDDLKENILSAEKLGLNVICNTDSYQTKKKIEAFLRN